MVLFGQDTHTSSIAPPELSKKRPKGQSVAAGDPSPGAYFPIGARVQPAAPGGEKVPAGQFAQAPRVDAPPVPLNFPAGQLTQAEDVCPGAWLYVPARHGLQSEAAVPPAESRAFPAGQGVQRDEPGASANEPGGQLPQSCWEDAPLKGFSVPRGQARHPDSLFAPEEGPKRPGGQGSQVVPPA